MNNSEFAALIKRPESENLDFKGDAYDIKDSKDRNKFIKDLLAMANTPRQISAYIILGVRWNPTSGSKVVGLSHQIDDAEFQDAIGTDRVQPVPRFTYFPLQIDTRLVGVIEIPIGRDGPYTPTKDSSGVQAGAVYFRRGTQNARALASDLRRIHNWFNDVTSEHSPRENSWRQFVDVVENFDFRRTFILVSDRLRSGSADELAPLGKPPWRTVIDFDPDSEASGVLRAIQSTFEQHRVIHQAVRGDYRIPSQPGTHWFFAQGLSGREETLVDQRHTKWLKAYKKEISKQLDKIANSIDLSPVVAVVLWSDTSLLPHLRTLIEELHGAFGETLRIVMVCESTVEFAEFAEQTGATFLEMSFTNLCNGIASLYAERERPDNSQYFLPTASGALVETKANDWLWLSEEVELLHRSIGTTGEDNPTDYRLGTDISWRNLNLGHDCDRELTHQIRSQVEDDLRRRQTVRINLYHEPGGGGTTVGRRVSWELHQTYPVCILKRCTPRETAEKIGRISTLTESSVLVVVDGNHHDERRIEELYGFLKANQTPTVLLQVLRRFRRQETGRRQFWLRAQLTASEVDRFRNAYSASVPRKRRELHSLSEARNARYHNAFFFGLTAFGRNFRGLPRYVADRIASLTNEQRRVLAFLAIAHYYGQQSVPAQAFAGLLGFPRSTPLELDAVFADTASSGIDLVVRGPNAEWRTMHHLIALELMRQILGPSGGSVETDVWKQNLSSWSKPFVEFCAIASEFAAERFLELIRRVFIFRDNTEVLGTERAAQSQFSQYIEDVPSNSGKRVVFMHLVESFPYEAHFHAHFGRFLGLNGHYNEALTSVDHAIAVEPNDPTLHHMRGMVLRRSMRGDDGTSYSVDQLVDIARTASLSFEESRTLNPEGTHAYISEVQMIIELIDYVARQKGDIIRDVLARSSTDPYLQQVLPRAEELLDQVQHLYVGESPSTYAIQCRAKLDNIYGHFSTALQAWDSLLGRQNVVKPPIRRQIVYTLLRRRNGEWHELKESESRRIVRLLEENLQEEINDSTSLRLWLRAIRHLSTTPSLDSIVERVSYWKTNTSSIDAAYYLYVLHCLMAIQGSVQAVADSERALEECRQVAQLRRDRTRSFEWIGKGRGIGGLIHQSRLGEWRGNFWESTTVLSRCRGRIKEIGGPQKGKIVLDCQLEAFFVPGRSGFFAGRDENLAVECFLGFSFEGPRAWEVRAADVVV